MMSDMDYAKFLRGKIKAEFDCPVLVFGSSDPDDVVSVGGGCALTSIPAGC